MRHAALIGILQAAIARGAPTVVASRFHPAFDTHVTTVGDLIDRYIPGIVYARDSISLLPCDISRIQNFPRQLSRFRSVLVMVVQAVINLQ